LQTRHDEEEVESIDHLQCGIREGKSDAASPRDDVQ
jgi:hypothetical protein